MPLMFFSGGKSAGQGIDLPDSVKREYAIRIFIDCRECDMDYIRREIPYVNYVRDTWDAQVYILETQQETGSGGDEYTFFFQGQLDLQGMNDTLTYASRPDDTRDNIRYGRTRMLKIGLMRYVAKSPLIQEIEIIHEEGSEDEVVVDRWNNWVFELDINPEYEGEESYKSLDLENSINALKITPDWKLEFDLEYDMRRTKYISDDTTIVALRESIYMDNLIVKSLSNHWSAGGFFSFRSSTYGNLKHNFEIYPSVEYNIFPYSESNHRQLRILYGLGANLLTYNDSTIYDMIRENRMHQRLLVAFRVQERWGSVNVSLEASNYFFDFSKNRLALEGHLRVRIIKGLSLSLYGDVGRIHDQLSLVKGELSETEVLLRLRELETEYNYDFGVGLTYTFGAIYNNIVNPRFGN
ncbi:MAG: hypothetical protein JSV24_05250 [Bacteroidales bacterium]|nr:MAG: hypothetical protein JSV24_05250 [Bacteroidales bacterium]